MTSPQRTESDIDDLVSRARAAVASAETDGPDASTREALRHCVQWLENSRATKRKPAAAYSGFIDYTIDDEEFGTHFRQFDMRIYYSWEDYDRDDEPGVIWGANVERCEVRAVHYFDEAGNELSTSEYHLDEALKLMEERHQLVTDACTEDGYRNGAGECHPLYSLPTSSTPPANKVAPRMAPSSRTRQTPEDRRNLG
jgi:hypothetical protein